MRTHKFSFIKLGAGVVILPILATLVFISANPQELPQLVDAVRSVVGAEPVAFVENVYYDLADLVKRSTFSGRTTPGFWTAPVQPSATVAQVVTATLTPTGTPTPPIARPSHVQPGTATILATTTTSPPIPTGTSRPTQTATPPRATAVVFAPTNLTPPYPALVVPGEGVWVPMPNAFDPTGASLMYKTFLHPDPQRPYARVAIVAIDARRVRLHAVAGTLEPASSISVPRTGLIPQSDLRSLIAAFNGGFKAIHGHFGMMVNGRTILPPQPNSDTIALYADGSVRIAPWTVLAGTQAQMQSSRQTPPYLVYNGHLNPGLVNEQSQLWGAYVDGNVIIWRSALGISADGRTLYYAAGESLSARRLAEAVRAAGASSVAQLDVNASFERFLTYSPPSGNYKEQFLLPAMNYQPGMYVSSPAPRDFFYLTLVPGVK